MNTIISDYDLQANKFLTDNGIKFNAKFHKHGRHFIGEKETRDIWFLSLSRKGKRVTFKFGQSIANVNQTPTAYDLLACLTKNDPGLFENFCSDYGYEYYDSQEKSKYLAIYRSVLKEFEKVDSFFTSDEIELLQQIY